MLSDLSARLFRKSGFTIEEIAELHESIGNVDATSPAWVSTRRTRRELLARLKSEGWSRRQYLEMLATYYSQRGKKSVWEFLKAEYLPRRTVDFMAARRARRRVDSGLQRAMEQVRRG